jgi:hypothetical protein
MPAVVVGLCPHARAIVRGPGVQPSGVQSVHCSIIWLPRPARTRLSGRLVSGPSGVQPSGACPSVRSQPSRPASPGWWRWGTLGRAGSRSHWIESSSVWSGRLPGGSVDGPRRHGYGHRCGGRVEAGGGASAAGLGGVCSGGRLHPTRQARPPRGAPGRWRLRSSRGAGRSARLPHGTVWRPYGLEPRLLCVVVAEPAGRVDGPGRITRARRRGWRAAPARPRQVASASGSTPATP